MADYNFKLVCADIDGTLIENGDFINLNPRLKNAIKEMRKKKILFSINSGRDILFIKNLYRAFTDNMPPLPGEAFLYEDVGLDFPGGKNYVFGGLDKKILTEIKTLPEQNPAFFKGLVQLPENKFHYRIAWVTNEFANNKPTNKEILEARYGPIKNFIEFRYDAAVKKSADAVDVVAKGADKKIPFGKYLEILQKDYLIFPEQVLVIGDAENDFGIMRLIMQKGGFAGFVGNNKSLEKILREIDRGRRLMTPRKKFSEGTTELIEKYVL